MFCENCEKDHSGSYGSGRFCSAKCARGYSTKNKREEINRKVSDKLKGKLSNPNQGRSNNWNSSSSEKAKQSHLNNLLNRDFDSLGFDTKRKLIILEQEGKCNKCGLSEWFGLDIVLEIEHKNGINDDDRRDNLEGLCPNCHSLTDTWRGRNKPSINGKTKVSDQELLFALENSSNIRQALLKVGLSAKGGNYSRAKNLMLTLPV